MVKTALLAAGLPVDEIEQSPNVVLALVPHGGHVAHFEVRQPEVTGWSADGKVLMLGLPSS